MRVGNLSDAQYRLGMGDVQLSGNGADGVVRGPTSTLSIPGTAQISSRLATSQFSIITSGGGRSARVCWTVPAISLLIGPDECSRRGSRVAAAARVALMQLSANTCATRTGGFSVLAALPDSEASLLEWSRITYLEVLRRAWDTGEWTG